MPWALIGMSAVGLLLLGLSLASLRDEARAA